LIRQVRKDKKRRRGAFLPCFVLLHHTARQNL
jgi:hypothetical protein